MNDCPKLTTDLCTPKILWYQTDATVVMRIMLPGVENYFLRVDNDHLRFSTIVGERKYYICIYLFGAVKPENSTHFNKGREVTVHLQKAHRYGAWLRLVIDKKKNSQIVCDPDRLAEKDLYQLSTKRIAEFRALQNEYMRRNNITQILPDGRSSDEEESEDETNDALFDCGF